MSAFRQLRVGRDEPIIEPNLPIIDAHHHLFDRPAIRYLTNEYLSDVGAGHRIIASVYVETNAFSRTDGPELMRPLGEVEFANEVATASASGKFGPVRLSAAIVGHADLRHGDAVGAYLDQAMAIAPGFRGVRQIANDHPTEAPYAYMVPPPRNLLGHPSFRDGCRQLMRRGLSFDAALFHHQLPDLAALADAMPDLSIVLNHAGQAINMDGGDLTETRHAWRSLLLDLARRPNVSCKIGGFGLPFWGIGFDQREDPIGSGELAIAWRPYVETAIEAFGAERCMMESDYPVDSRSAGFVPLWNALKLIVRGSSASEKAALFHNTAKRVYRIEITT